MINIARWLENEEICRDMPEQGFSCHDCVHLDDSDSEVYYCCITACEIGDVDTDIIDCEEFEEV